MAHGWVSRGDVKDKKIARDVNLAFERAADFLQSLK
jgi:hypothetical protein